MIVHSCCVPPSRASQYVELSVLDRWSWFETGTIARTHHGPKKALEIAAARANPATRPSHGKRVLRLAASSGRKSSGSHLTATASAHDAPAAAPRLRMPNPSAATANAIIQASL